MSAAAEKNRQAFIALFGNAALADMLIATRIAVSMPASPAPRSAQLLLEVLADSLGRLWPNIDFDGHGGEHGVRIAQEAATSGGAPTEGIRLGWAPPYDVVVVVGSPERDHVSPTVQVGCDGWRVQFGAGAVCGEGSNPVGPAFAAALASAQVFATRFAHALEGHRLKPFGDWSADVRALFGAPELAERPLDLEGTHFFGTGAVTHGMAWLLERWPQPIIGAAALVDADDYGSSNGQRYAFLKPGLVGASKVHTLATRLMAVHPGLLLSTHHTDMNTYCAGRGYDEKLFRIVAGLDSEEARRQAALKDPNRTINMWTSGQYVGAGQHVPGVGQGCLFCAYPEPMAAVIDEVAEFHQQTGLRPDIVRNLLDSARPLTAEEASTVSANRNIPVGHILGEPLRSVLPILCATGSITVEPGKAAVDVPFSFASLLAGASGFVMLLRDLQFGAHVSEGWNEHIFKRPSPTMMHPQGRDPLCVRCGCAEDIGQLPSEAVDAQNESSSRVGHELTGRSPPI